MHRLTAHPSFLLTLLTAFQVANAQEPIDVTGTWQVTWDSGVRSRGADVIEVTRRATATLHLTQRGDSVTGLWVMEKPLGRSAEWTVTGLMREHQLSLASETHPVEGLPTRLTWTGTVANDDVRGTMHVHLGESVPPPRRWEGKRERSDP